MQNVATYGAIYAKIVAVSVRIHPLMLRHSVFVCCMSLALRCTTAPWTARGRVLGCMRHVAADMRSPRRTFPNYLLVKLCSMRGLLSKIPNGNAVVNRNSATGTQS